MTEPMTQRRFRGLAQAYGGSIARWPDDDHQAGALMATEPWARAALAEAGKLDRSLDAWSLPVASDLLHACIAASAPVTARGLMRSARLWWSGLGVAAALAGSAVGAMAASTIAPVQGAIEPITAFGDLGQEDAR